MKKSEGVSFWAAVVVILILFAALIGGFYLLVKAVGVEGSLIWSTLIAAIGWIVSEHISRKREHQKLLAEQKREMYFKFLEFVLSFTRAVRDGEEDVEATPEQLDELSNWSLKLGLIGSDEVVKAWNSFRANAGTGEGSKLFAPMAALLSAMRKDCSHYGTTLTPLELLSLMIKGDDLHQIEAALSDDSASGE